MDITEPILRGYFAVGSTLKIDEILMTFPGGFSYVVPVPNRCNCFTGCLIFIAFEFEPENLFQANLLQVDVISTILT